MHENTVYVHLNKNIVKIDQILDKSLVNEVPVKIVGLLRKIRINLK